MGCSFFFCLFQGKKFLFHFVERKKRGNWLMAAKLLLPFSCLLYQLLFIADIWDILLVVCPVVAFDFQREIATFSGRVAMIPSAARLLFLSATVCRRLLLLRRCWLSDCRCYYYDYELTMSMRQPNCRAAGLRPPESSGADDVTVHLMIGVHRKSMKQSAGQLSYGGQ